ncbi:protein phosphatase 2C, putative [Trypanosoma equiperdum]|uniref:Protein phosphatase n=3 Tax=Trypanozoon TaxID=39700 RepID=Q386X6_TRYB2|nr:protein phosphatase 2C, putative [Trypanosoma brucei gambiense DAL972]XP_828267.1 protein phosphatase 2C, putative [Trypanosoma brucei brucei TREU927]EAN79155.1 protein phosphatase 2C, putative [Trypanosoma brucei brucei TREU927]CBH17076.1 protein phosphatase 2C, putative [Trypanosoma brucei gambiense DAL972]SCU71207.1 protein phosphatase 2C, putative [Trypanosoma equiperdum]|eukprot:XP_011779340.1 protein phosphatase 2C, putative [Trypanosoma brucei gambiense DAL972]
MHVVKLLLRHNVGGRSLAFDLRAVNLVSHPKRSTCGGEDAFLSMSEVQCVFDGVSWWKEYAGVDSGLYSAALAKFMYSFVEDDALGSLPLSSCELLQRAYDACLSDEIHGTSTALVATLQRPCCAADASCSVSAKFSNCMLDVCSIGDCTSMIIRDGRIVFVSDEQMHSFDYPFQLGQGSADIPVHSLQYRVVVRPGDVLLLGSDGIFDNVFKHDIAELVWKFVGPVCGRYALDFDRPSQYDVATKIIPPDDVLRALSAGVDEVVRVASANARDVKCNTPYSNKAIENGANYRGGRLDDMTLLGSIIDEKFDLDRSVQLAESGVLLPTPYRDWP